MRLHIPARRGLAVGAAAITLAALVAPTAAAAPTTTSDTSPSDKITASLTLSDGSQAENVPNRWFVELSSPSQSEGTSAATITKEQNDLKDAIEDADIDATVTHAYGELWNGVSLSVPDDQVEDLAALPEVRSVQPVVIIPESKDVVADDGVTAAEEAAGVSAPQMVNALDMTGAGIAQSQLGLTGKGVRIGIIDSGVDYDHKEFGGSGVSGPEPSNPSWDGSTSFPTSKVKWGYDFVGNAYGDKSLPEDQVYTAKPDAFPDDCGGHGTHVAGIAAADAAEGTDEIRGVAPDAELGAYRVFGCTGSTSSDVMAAAMQMAADQGMDVVNMSIGADYVVFSDYPTAVSADAMADKGIVVTVAQGNIGDKGRWTMGAPGSSNKVITVGSVDNVIETNYYLTVSTNEGAKFAYATGSGSTADVVRDDDASFPLVAAGDPAADLAAAELCDPVADGAFEGKTVIIRRGGCTFRQKVLGAQAAGAVGVILDNNTDGVISADLSGTDGQTIDIPVASVSQADGDAIRAALTDDSTLTFTTQHAEFPVATGGQVSDYSSWGLNSDLSLKPDVSAPGGLIWSTWPIDQGGPYKTISGTSMATPYTAGSIALILQAHPEIKDLNGTAAKDAVAWRLRSTATPLTWAGGDDASKLEPLARQGAGLISVDQAIEATTEVSPSVLNLGESKNGPTTTEVTLTNHGTDKLVYTLGHTDAVTITGVSAAPTEGTASPATVSTDGASVTLAAGASATLSVTITAPEGITDGDFYSGWVTLTPQANPSNLTEVGDVLRIPYSGVGGNLAGADVFGVQSGTGPYLADLNGKEIDPASYVYGGSALDNAGAYEDLPVVRFGYDVPVQKSELTVTPVNADGSLGASLGVVASSGDWHARTETSYYVWDGHYVVDDAVQQAPSGRYVLTLRALPVGGVDAVATDWAEWPSEPLTLDWRTDGYLAQDQLTVTSPGGAEPLTDDNIFTNASAEGTKADYTVSLGGTYRVSAIQVTPDQVATATRPTKVTVYTSTNGKTFKKVATVGLPLTDTNGTNATEWDPTTITLPKARKAQAIRLVFTNGQDGATTTSVAEVRVAGEKQGKK